MAVPLLEIRNLAKRFPQRQGREPAPWIIRDLTFSVADGEFLTIIGPSGAGKSTLLNMIAQIDVATAGDIFFKGDKIAAATIIIYAVGYLFDGVERLLLRWRPPNDVGLAGGN
jgi:ABC-type sugar transport system ATPase subunit